MRLIISRDRLYFYIGFHRSQDRFLWEFKATRQPYLWILCDITVLRLCLSLTLRLGKRPDVAKQGIDGDSSEFCYKKTLPPLKREDGEWTEWEL